MARLRGVLVGLVLVAAACGDSGATTTEPPPTTAPPVTTTGATTSVPVTEPAGGAAASLGEARGAVVQVVAKGTFVDPFEGVQANVPGSGSAFVIDPSGLAVTNNHVVTGAALLEVFVDGEDEPRNARVVGVSECSDLAVVDIAGPDLPFLAWYEGDITAGLDIFAAGYPLGDPEYTLLDGIVSKEDAGGETSWASVDAVIEHSANTLPGSSGGPILTSEGRVVAVNYAGNDVGQSFAIGREVARPVVERLVAGEDVDSIGVNGEALFAGGFGGIWVYSVESGSPADRAGLAAGDLITRLEGLDLGGDGTMAEYCDVLRSHSPDDVLTVEVYRQATDEILEGQLNGPPLEAVFSFATELDDMTEPPATGDPYTEFVGIADDSGTITVTVPAEWNDVSGVPWDFDGEQVGPALSAAPDLDAFFNTWGTPGVFVAASDSLPISRSELLEQQDFSSSCSFLDRLDYDDGLYVGEFDVWEDCGDEGSTFLVVAAEPPGGFFTILVQIVIVDERDLDAADEIIDTFIVAEDMGLSEGGGPPPTGPGLLASGLFCADVADLGFWYGDAAAYWVREGRPARMDEDGNGIPCETVYDGDQIDSFYTVWFNEPGGLLCADLAAAGYHYGDALAYWIAEGAPDRMDVDTNGIPCESVFGSDEIDPFLFFEFSVG